MRRLTSALLLLLLLLLTQQAAFVHELGHLAQQVQQSDGPDRQSHGVDYCEKCFVFAHLSGASPASPAAVWLALFGDECATAPRAVHASTETSACRIRGPPFRL
jgi:hypothetical protein